VNCFGRSFLAQIFIVLRKQSLSNSCKNTSLLHNIVNVSTRLLIVGKVIDRLEYNVSEDWSPWKLFSCNLLARGQVPFLAH
jgi:hypothetical protein